MVEVTEAYRGRLGRSQGHPEADQILRRMSWAVPVSIPNLESPACSLPAQPASAGGTTPGPCLSAANPWLPSTTVWVKAVTQEILSVVEFLFPHSLGYPHIPNASPILLFAPKSTFVTGNDLLIVYFPLASFQGFVANVKYCLKHVFLLVE